MTGIFQSRVAFLDRLVVKGLTSTPLKIKYRTTVDKMKILTLIVEAVDSVDAGALVVAAQQKEILRVLDLVGQQQADGLQRLLA